MDKTYTISEVATKLNLSDKTLRRWEDSGKFTTSRTLGNQRRYSLEDLQILDAIKHGLIDKSSDLLTLPQAAALCGVAPSSVERWVREGKIHPFITSGKTYYPKARLVSKLDELSHGKAETPSLASGAGIPTLDTTPPPTPQPPPLPTPTPPSPAIALAEAGSTSLESHKQSLSPIISQFLITTLIVLFYHLLTSTISSTGEVFSPSSPTDITLTETTQQESLVDSLFDKVGNLKTQGSLTSTGLTLLPHQPPSPVPGTLYFDAGSSTLRLFTDTWTDISTPSSPLTPLALQETSLLSGTNILKKGVDNILINNKYVTPTTPVVVTFTSDYSPAKKYWLEQDQGSFTLNTDFPVGQNSTFTYLILVPALDEAEAATDSPTVF